MQFTLRDRSPAKFVLPWAPMISLGVLLLTLVLCDHQFVAQAKQIDVNLPRSVPQSARSDEHAPAKIRVGLRSDARGDLAQITFEVKSLGRDDAAFERLSREVRQTVHRVGNPLTSDIEVEIDADADLQYKHVIRAVAACTGQIDPLTKTLVRAVEKITFTSPREPITRD